MRFGYFFVSIFLGYILVEASSHARLPKIEEFPETRKSLDSSRVPFLPPSPAYCRQEMYDKYVRNTYVRVIGSCGALEKLWKEAHRLLEHTVSTNLILMDMQSANPGDQADSCQTQDRLRKIQTTKVNLKSVQDRALAEGDRIMKVCEKDLEEYKTRLRTIEANCSAAITPMLPLNKKEAESNIKQGNQFLKNHDKEERNFLTRVSNLNQQLKEQEQSAIACKNSISPVLDPSNGGGGTSFSTSVATEIGVSTNTNTSTAIRTSTNASTRTKTQTSTEKSNGSNSTTIYKSN